MDGTSLEKKTRAFFGWVECLGPMAYPKGRCPAGIWREESGA